MKLLGETIIVAIACAMAFGASTGPAGAEPAPAFRALYDPPGTEGWRATGSVAPAASWDAATLVRGVGSLSRPLDRARDLGGDPANADWAFEARLRISGEPAVSPDKPFLALGLRDEAGSKRVMFELLREQAGLFRVRAPGNGYTLPLGPLGDSELSRDLRDGRFHTLRILKRFGVGVPNHRVLFFVDGVRWTTAGYGFHYGNQMPGAATTDGGIELSVLEPGVTVEIDYIAWGPPDAERARRTHPVAAAADGQSSVPVQVQPRAEYAATLSVVSKGKAATVIPEAVVLKTDGTPAGTFTGPEVRLAAGQTTAVPMTLVAPDGGARVLFRVRAPEGVALSQADVSDPLPDFRRDRTPTIEIAAEQLGRDLPLARNRFYDLTATATNRGEAKASFRFHILQYRKDRQSPEFPEWAGPEVTLAPGESREIRHRFYAWMQTERVRLVPVPGEGSALPALREIRLRGGEPYDPGTPAGTLERVPELDAAAKEAILARPAYTAKVERVGGRPRILVNGKPVPPALYAAPMGIADRGHVGDFARAGVHMHAWHLLCGSGGYEGGIWLGKGRFDFARLEAELWRILAADPEAMVQLLVWMDPYRAWGEENPDDVCRNDRGEPAVGVNHLKRWGAAADRAGGGKVAPPDRLLPSLYSRRMREDGAGLLRALIAFLREKRLLGRVAGFGIVGFNDAQFVNWAHWERERMDDYSPCALAAFREWLRRRYGADEAALRRAWGRDDVGFETAAIPPPERRRGEGLWLDARTYADVADWNRFYAEGPVEFMEHFARTVKEATGGEKLVSIYFASPLNAALSGTALGRVLASPSFDLLHCPAHYGPRLPGHVGGCQSATGSVLLHDRVFLTEQDWRSWRSTGDNEAFDHGVGRAPDAWSMQQMIRRESGMLLAQGNGTWWLELAFSAFDDPQIMAAVAEAAGAFRADLEGREAPEADVAFFLGERSLDYLANTPQAVEYRWQVLRHQRDNWNMSGVPYHVYLQSDLPNPRLPRYRVCVLVSPEAMGTEERAAVEALKRDGRTLVFLHAPNSVGAADPVEGVREVAGIAVAPAGEIRHAGEWIGGENPLLAGLEAGTPLLPRGYGGLGGSQPLTFAGYHITDPDVVPLARFEGTEKVCLAARDFGTWRSVLCTLPLLEPQFLSNLAAWSGAWRAAGAGDALYASQDFLTIHALRPGRKVLTLRAPSRVRDLATGKDLPGVAKALTLDLEFGETRWFRLRR